MTEKGNSSMLLQVYVTPPTVLSGEGWWTSVSVTHGQIFSMGDRFEDRAGPVNNRIPCDSKKVPPSKSGLGPQAVLGVSQTLGHLEPLRRVYVTPPIPLTAEKGTIKGKIAWRKIRPSQLNTLDDIPIKKRCKLKKVLRGQRLDKRWNNDFRYSSPSSTMMAFEKSRKLGEMYDSG
ncbi:hypothetical protein TNCV_3970301 [Trichonephila clavipes]|nr:hypothetical protein TNCV_3970301 [Trichonephila clavipes]